LKAGQALFNGLLRFVRAAHFLVELSDIFGNLLLGFRFRLAGEYFSLFLSMFIAFVFTFVGSVSISRSSSSCRMYLATVLALMSVCWLMCPMLGQH